MISLFRLRGLSYGERKTAQHKCPKCRSIGTASKYVKWHDIVKVFCFDCGFGWSLMAATPGEIKLAANPAPAKPHTP